MPNLEWPGHFGELLEQMPPPAHPKVDEITENLKRLWVELELYRAFLADAVGAAVKVPVSQSFATSGHSENSQHYVGKAADCRAWQKRRNGTWQLVPLSKQWETAHRIAGIHGIGAYPDWKTHGLHLDMRDAPLTWLRLNGKYHYNPTISEILDLLVEATQKRRTT